MSGAGTILLLEDDLEVRFLTAATLESQGFVVLQCGSIAEAVQTFETASPDLGLLDIILPDGNGIQLLNRLNGKSQIPLLVLTGKRDIITRLEAFKAGARDYIEKPFSIDELVARVRVHLEIKQSQDALKRKACEAELRARARQDLSDMILHDLKAPLTSIKGTLDLIKMGGIITERAYGQLVDRAGSAADFMLLMLNDLLDTARNDHHDLRVSPAEFELKRAAERIEALFGAKLQSTDVKLRFTIPREAERVDSDPNLVFRVLVNLIANALRVAPRGSAVEVDASVSGDALSLTVSDRGPGVPDDKKAAVFEKFMSEGDHDGHGIGLAFCRLAAQALKGSIAVEDRPGGGSVFRITLPGAVRSPARR